MTHFVARSKTTSNHQSQATRINADWFPENLANGRPTWLPPGWSSARSLPGIRPRCNCTVETSQIVRGLGAGLFHSTYACTQAPRMSKVIATTASASPTK
ncbi:hypothetical protein M758_8G069000 [Ceratodon purpureus]|nr:hypothetical protein M758_8G069000 [Ceratodon purpureus]